MCTALTLKTKDHYFGRNLDLDRSYGEEVCIMPRHFPLSFRKMEEMNEHYAIIGMATVVDGLPLFYDAANEYGLAMAGLNFPGNAYYTPLAEGKDNIAPFEFIPWILSQCKTTADAKMLLSRMNLADIFFREQIPLSPLHWMISDAESSIVVEFMKDGLHIHNNKIGVLTNNPPFEHHITNLQQYQHLRNDNANVEQKNNIPYTSYSQGMGAIGLPGDISSMSRFVRMAFEKEHSICGKDELSAVNQFFHLLSSVEMVKGVCKTDEGTLDITVYSSCINTDRGLYYYKTYSNHRITCVDMHHTDLDSDTLSHFSLVTEESIYHQN